jgi:hypothetical protein
MGKGLSADFYKVLDDNELMKHYMRIRYEPASLDNAAHNLEVEVARIKKLPSRNPQHAKILAKLKAEVPTSIFSLQQKPQRQISIMSGPPPSATYVSLHSDTYPCLLLPD